MSSKILIVGIGAIGSIISHRMISCGIGISMMTRSDRQRVELIELGLSNEERTVYADNVYTISDPPQSKFELIIISTKTNALDPILHEISKMINSEGVVLFVQNGYIRDIVKKHSLLIQSVRGIAGFGGRKLNNHEFKQYTKGSLHIGTYADKQINIGKVINLLGKSIDTEVHDNIMNVVWSKLAVNCTLNGISSITGLKIGDLFSNNKTFLLMKKVFNEVKNVAYALGYKIIAVSFDPDVFDCVSIENSLTKKLAVKYKNSIPSTLQSIINGNKTEYEHIGGAVVDKAKIFGINVPINILILKLIRDVENGIIFPNLKNVEYFKYFV